VNAANKILPAILLPLRDERMPHASKWLRKQP
jgi:hypothetical protein